MRTANKARMSQKIVEELFTGKRRDAESGGKKKKKRRPYKGKKNVNKRCSETAGKDAE